MGGHVQCSQDGSLCAFAVLIAAAPDCLLSCRYPTSSDLKELMMMVSSEARESVGSSHKEVANSPLPPPLLLYLQEGEAHMALPPQHMTHSLLVIQSSRCPITPDLI